MTPVLALLLLIPQDTAPRLNMRFEVLWRAREFERNWMKECAQSRRVAARQVLGNDSANCIAAKSGECAQRIDIAQEALTAGRFRSLHPNLGLAVSQRLCDRSQPTTYLHAPRVYNVEPLDWILKKMRLSVSGRSCGELSVDDESVATSDLVRSVRLGLERTTVGDLSVDASLWPGD